MRDDNLDPVFVNSRREALIILGLFAVALIYTVTYCYLCGYNRAVESIETYWGIPDWVFWGVFAPWAVCAIFTTWFVFCYMADDDLDQGAATDEDTHDAG
jgi:hypothetical protein